MSISVGDVRITMLSDVYSKDAKIVKINIKSDPDWYSERVVIGVDPGTVHMGIAHIWRENVHLYEVTVERDTNPVARIKRVWRILDDCSMMIDYVPIVLIEGSAFSKGFREAELSEVRASSVLWAHQHRMSAEIVNALSIRKMVFGSAKIHADVFWPSLKKYPNAAAALSVALYHLQSNKQ